MRVLITGVDGFVGRHLAEHLAAEPGYQLYFSVRQPPTPPVKAPGETINLDLRDYDGVKRVVETIQPDAIYHLAAQASVRASLNDPWATLQNNIQAQFNVLQALAAHGSQARVLVVSSAEVYGAVRTGKPVDESTPFAPQNPYSVSKAAQDLLGLQYFLAHHVPTIRVRPFNHTGPGQQASFVAADFASQIARIERGEQPPVLRVGNLAAERDFTDVRDIVRAYHLLMTSGTPGEAYNVGSGTTISIQHLLDTLLSFSRVQIEVVRDPQRFRPVDIPRMVCDNSKLISATGWQPQYSIEQTLHDLLEEVRGRTA